MEVALRSGDLEAVFVPEVGMVGRSLRHRGDELLGQRGGLEAYAERGSSFGIPLLHPWANRLDRQLGGGRAPLKLDANGLPMHGLLTAAPGWEVVDAQSDLLRARFGFASDELLEAFPHPHELTLTASLDPGGLTIDTELRPTADGAVPIAFGWHPYLTLPGVPRAEWQVEMPVAERAVLDDRGIPTGGTDPIDVEPGPLGELVFDDLFPGIERGARFVLHGGGRRLAVVFDAGYPVAQVYAPEGQDLICFEPMTAPTNALVSGDGLRHAQPGETFAARFRIEVS